MIRVIKIFVMMCVVIVQSISADENTTAAAPAPRERERGQRDETRFRMNGFLETGIDVHTRVNRDETESRIIARGEIEISARPARARRLRAEMGFEYNYHDEFVTVDKFYAQYGITDNGIARAGIMKKSFGLEERAGVAERYFHRRSIINDRLEDLGFLDHDLTIFYRHDINEKLRASGGLSWSVEDTSRYLQNYAVQYAHSENLTFIGAIIFRHYVIPDHITAQYNVEGIATTFVSSLSFAYATPLLTSPLPLRWEHETELTVGTNPQIKIEDNNRDAIIFGIRAQERFPVTVARGRLQEIIPLVELALYNGDINEGDVTDTQIRGGLTLAFTESSALQFRNTYSVTLRTHDNNTRLHRRRFDSQVVVVF